MTTSVTISRIDEYAFDGSLEGTYYRIEVNEDNEFIQDMQLSTIEDMTKLRDVLHNFITRQTEQHHEQ